MDQNTLDGLKLLFRAVKAQYRTPAPVTNYTESSLPDLYGQTLEQAPAQPIPPQTQPSWQTAPTQEEKKFDLDLTRKGLSIQTHLANALLGRKAIDIQANEYPLRGKFNYNGDMSVNASTPLWGGDLNFDYSKNSGNNRYYIQFKKDF